MHSEKPSDNASPSFSVTISLVKKYVRAIFGHSPEKVGTSAEKNVTRMPVRSNLEYTDIRPDMPSSDRNVDCVPEIEYKSGADKVITRLEGDGVSDMSKENPCTSVDGTTMLLNGRKRLKDSMTNKHLEHDVNWTQQKKARQKRPDAAEVFTPIVLSCCHILDNGKPHVSETSSLVGNAALLSASCNGKEKTPEQETGSAFLEPQEPA